jgi:hypothetical protein
MAQKVFTQLIDDLDGGDAVETVSFGLDGREYEIDLNSDHADGLRGVFEPFVSAARRTGGRLRQGRKVARDESTLAGTPVGTAGPAGDAPAQQPARQPASLPRRTAALRVTKVRPKPDPAQIAAIRVWGRENGYVVKDIGRLSEDLIAAYHARGRRTQRTQ